jgi:glutathione S-transferase
MGVPHGGPPELMQAMMAFGAETAPRWLKVLDGHMLAGRAYVCGDEVTIADHLGLAFVLLADLPEYDLSPYPNILAWTQRMKARPSFEPSYGTFYAIMAAFKAEQKAA